MSDAIKKARLSVSALGISEISAVANDETLQELFAQKQELIAEMNKQKRKAADEAAKPYMEAIEEIDKMYAFILILLGNNED
jgi:tRNA uridine 5-carbamoylmethylation protein Kti12